MKKVLKFLSIAMLIFSCGLLESCNHDANNSNNSTSSSTHTHNFVSNVSKEPTCKEEGLKVISCMECDYSYTEPINTLPHSLEYVVEEETHHQKCKNCDYVTESVNHSFDKLISRINPTCLVEGKEIYQCVCEKTSEVSLGLGNHSYKDYDFNSESHWQICEICKESHSEPINHTFKEEIIKKVTCDVDGKKKFTCVCGYSYEETLFATGHDIDYSLIVSRTQSGHYYNCKKCNQKVVFEHEYVEADCEYNRPSTCYQDGHQDYKCSICEFTTHRNLGKNNEHNFSSDWESNGTHHWHNCLNGDGKCQEKYQEAVHTYVDVTINPTCTEEGRINTTCEICGFIQKYEIIKTTGHNYQEEILKEATCTEVGQVKKVCSICSDEVIEEIPLAKHTWNDYAYNDDYHWKKCSECGVEQTGSKKGHTLIEEVIKEANCKEHGQSKFTCEFCGYSITKETIKNHAYHFNDDATEATCMEVSHWTETCEYCGDVINVSGKEYAAHNIIYYERVEASEDKDGNNPYWECQVCHKYFKSKDCSVELTKEDIIIPATKEVITDLSLLESYGNTLKNGETSSKVYEVTGKVSLIDLDEYQVLISDDKNNDYLIQFLANANIDTLKENDILTVKLNLTKDETGVVFTTNVVIVNVESSGELYSIYIAGNDYSSYNYCYITSGNGSYITNDTFNILEKGETITITIYFSNNLTPVLKINDKEVTISITGNGEGIVTYVVDGDVHIELTSK